MNAGTAKAIADHEMAGSGFEATGVRSFALDAGEGDAVVLLHGVPASCFLYRKVVPRLADAGFRAIAFDFPGLGLAERPVEYDYSWSGLVRFVDAALATLAVERCHLVVHDIGGPIGFEWAVRNPERVRSLTALNSFVNVAEFRRPWSMHPFSVRGLGEVWLRSLNRWAFSLLKLEDGGRAFLRVMRGFELTRAKQEFLGSGLAERPYPAQAVWGIDDPALGRKHMELVSRVLGVQPTELPAKHFLQEDQAPAVVEAIAALASEPKGV